MSPLISRKNGCESNLSSVKEFSDNILTSGYSFLIDKTFN